MYLRWSLKTRKNKSEGKEMKVLNEYPSGHIVTVDNLSKQYGAPNLYTIHIPIPHGKIINSTIDINFQNGPIKEVGVNGINEDMLFDILIDRYENFLKCSTPSIENSHILRHLRMAKSYSEDRTQNRELRGVEGTSKI